MDNCEYRSRIVCNTDGSLINDKFPRSSALSRIGGFRRSGKFLSVEFFRAETVVLEDQSDFLALWVDGLSSYSSTDPAFS
jgi:hypothetical protein